MTLRLLPQTAWVEGMSSFIFTTSTYKMDQCFCCFVFEVDSFNVMLGIYKEWEVYSWMHHRRWSWLELFCIIFSQCCEKKKHFHRMCWHAEYHWTYPLITCIFPRTPVLSIRLATFTVFPQISYCGFWAPMTPAITGPWLIPDKGRETISEHFSCICTGCTQ